MNKEVYGKLTPIRKDSKRNGLDSLDTVSGERHKLSPKYYYGNLYMGKGAEV